MRTDDQLLDLLARALDDGPASPPPERITALRAMAEADRNHRTPPTVVGRRAERSIRRIGSPWLAVAAAVVALAVGAIVGSRFADQVDDDSEEIAGNVEYDGPMSPPGSSAIDADLTVVATGIGRVVDLKTDLLPILPVGEFYQVWFVGPGDSRDTPNRISAGTFHPDADGRSDVRFTAAVDPDQYPVVEITAEPGDGDPSPTGPVVLRAEIPPSP